jgi:hypothetical protein
MTTQTQTIRTVAGIINSVETLEGAGFLVRRPFPKSSFSEFDPFLLLDELATSWMDGWNTRTRSVMPDCSILVMCNG